MSNKLYTSIPAPKVPRNVFNLSRYNSLTMPYQRVCPTAVQEIIPGDKFFWSAEVFARLQPMVAPVMTDQKISLHAFFVPLRTINSHFAEFMFNNKSGNYSDVLPYTYLSDIYNGLKYLRNTYPAEAVDIIRLLDYIGLPFAYRSATDQATYISNWITDNASFANSNIRVNLAPFIAYTKVWSEYFRDENLVDDPFETFESVLTYSVTSVTGYQSFLNAAGTALRNFGTYFLRFFCRLRPRAWQHDRFTSSLPFAQRGPDVLLPVGAQQNLQFAGPDDGLGAVQWDPALQDMFVLDSQGEDAGNIDVESDIQFTTTINDFRRAERLQRWYENSARGGTRPNEATLAHFGVHTPDSTLDRSEFLGGTMQPIVVSEVAQTSESTQSSPQGTLAGKGTSYKSGGLFRHYFTEHGFVFVFVSALVRPAYWQGVPKIFSRMQRDEYYWPEFALLGEEPVFNKELFVDGNTTEDGVFGYVPRYSDYKSALPEVHGDFRTSLDFWVNPRKFANQPQLNEEFIFGYPQKKMFAVQSDFADSLLVTIRHGVKASRLMPFYGVPTI